MQVSLIFLLAALFFHITGAGRAAHGAGSVFHAGQSAVHVTRLHRYEHAGMAAMLEAERIWQHTVTSESVVEIAELGVQPKTDGSQGFVRLSFRQAEALQEHHQQVLQDSKSTLHAGHVKQIHDYQGTSPENGAKLAVERLSNLDSQYVGPIGVGTVVAPSGCSPAAGESLVFLSSDIEGATQPAKQEACHVEEQSKVWVVFDTGSTNIWIASDLCKSGACVKPGRHRYDHTMSSTFQSPEHGSVLEIQFGTGKLRGPQGVEDFHVGPFTVKNQTFGMIEVQDGRVFEDVPFEGIMGLAFPSMSANGVTPFFDNIIHQKAMPTNEFAFYFSLDTPAANGVFWGGVDKAFYNDKIEYYPVTDPFYWSLPLLAFQIGNETLLGGGTDGLPLPAKGATSSFLQKGGAVASTTSPKAIVDSGTTYFTAEGPLFSDVMQKLQGKPCDQVSEDTHPPITYWLRSKSGEARPFKLNNKQYMTSTDGSERGMCTPAFMRIDIPSQHGPAMVLGEVFMRHYFSVFDRGDGKDGSGRVGFAPAAHGKDVQRRLKDLTQNQPAFQGKPDPSNE